MIDRTSKGFALPTVLIASAIMLTVLMASVTSLSSTRTALLTQYYDQIAQTANEAGVAYAKACLNANNGTATWSDSSPLQPNTDCNGVPISGLNCTPNSTTPGCFVTMNGNVRSIFSVAAVSIDSSGNAVVHSTGIVNLIRSSTGTIWRSYKQNTIAPLVVVASSEYGNGGDGTVTVSANHNLNTDALATGRTCADAINYSITTLTSDTATLSSAPAAGCLVAGDEVLLINLQGTSTNYANVGHYETLKIQSLSSNTITFTKNKTKYYGDGSSDDTNLGVATTNQRVMLQRIPNYTNFTVNTGITLNASAWDGVKNGVLFFRVSGTLTVAGNISTSGLGYRGGAGAYYYGGAGESYTGGPIASSMNSVNGNFGGAGGGDSSGVVDGSTGGPGGAGYAFVGTDGGEGRYGGFGFGGLSYGSQDLSNIFFGSGGGGNATVDWNDAYSGGIGGGIIYISSKNISVTGTISSNGSDGRVSADHKTSGGAGGSIYLVADTASIGAGLVRAQAGAGGDGSIWVDGGQTGQPGPSSVGRIRISGTLTGNSNPAAYNS